MQTHASPGSPGSPLARSASFVTVVTVALLVPALGAPVLAQSAQAERVREAGVVLGEIMAAPDRSIPESVLEKAEAIAVFPSIRYQTADSDLDDLAYVRENRAVVKS